MWTAAEGRARVAALVVSWAVASTAPGQAPASAAGRPVAERRAQAVLARIEAAGLRAGCAVTDVDRAEVLLRHRERVAMRPASNQKLLTLAAVLAAVGGDCEVVTRFRLAGGWLEVVGGGDPNWAAGTEHDPARIFAAVAAALRMRGVAAVRGVRVVAGAFTGPARHPAWEQYPEQRSWVPCTGAAVLEAGCVEFEFAVPAGGGDAATVRATAPDLGGDPIGGRVALVADRNKGSVYGVREREGRFEAFGHFWRRSSPVRVRVATRDAEAVFVRAAECALVSSGVAIDAGAAAADDGEVYRHRSRLREAFAAMMTDSSNFHAEQCARVMAAATRGDGSLAAAAAAVEAEIEELLGEWPELRVDDACGLSRDNRASPALLAALLSVAAHCPWGDELRASLPAPGEGTLRRRFRDSLADDDAEPSLRAKTGTLRDVRALSGYLRQRSGRTLAFSIILEGQPRARGFDAQRELEALVTALAEL